MEIIIELVKYPSHAKEMGQEKNKAERHRERSSLKIRPVPLLYEA